MTGGSAESGELGIGAASVAPLPRRSKDAFGAAGIAGRAVGAVGLAAVGVLHLVWAAGSPWPARDAAALADAVVGSEHVPAAGPTVGVAVLALGGAAVVGGAGGAGPIARLIRAGAAGALIARGLAGGVAATKALRLPDPSARFRRLDRVVYRPVCLVLGAAVALGSLGRIRRRKMG
ncbi:DUF3995 domain-containing protein [Microbacterium sp. MYb64]|uniref:DUF3995 domain-containing protein n=1 Tax=Microbacterium sp. MYb64 TaxID=1848691 RepID=UPI000CFC3250|nr:DUF3995 domain-containing protein [Microbacterium sp. MYb64]PRA97841.1 hypothetical protein CQ044_19260 [Microbacterium sp. MYb64]